MSHTLPVRYWEHGQPMISVTQVLTVAGRINPDWFTPEAAERGSAVHLASERYDRGESISLPYDWMGYVDAYASFVETVKPVYAIDGTECRVVHNQLKLAGRIDRVCDSIYGRPAILDIKTGMYQDWHGQQLAAYNRMRPTGARYCVYLRPDGKYKLHLHSDPSDHWKFFDVVRRVRDSVTPVQIGDDLWEWKQKTTTTEIR